MRPQYRAITIITGPGNRGNVEQRSHDNMGCQTELRCKWVRLGDAKMLCPKYSDKYPDNAMRARDTGH